jgi:hypothetical protein
VTVISFVEALKNELEQLFGDFKLRDEAGDEVGFTVYEHALPIAEREGDPEPFPYIIIQVVDGGTESRQSDEKVRVVLVIGVYDENADNQGTQDVLLAIQRIRRRFEKNVVLDSKYMALEPFRWTLADGSQYPYFFGGVEMTFAVPRYEVEDENA